ncbi:MAG: DnaJ domain-containing protein, partial [Thermoleophilia bacterium]|nr:DnaJ domain-containing protein [Thermoleophilia bacterium]
MGSPSRPRICCSTCACRLTWSGATSICRRWWWNRAGCARRRSCPGSPTTRRHPPVGPSPPTRSTAGIRPWRCCDRTPIRLPSGWSRGRWITWPPVTHGALPACCWNRPRSRRRRRSWSRHRPIWPRIPKSTQTTIPKGRTGTRLPTTRDYYEILGVSRDASDRDLKSAFRRLARELHPDVNHDDPTTEARFKEVAE